MTLSSTNPSRSQTLEIPTLETWGFTKFAKLLELKEFLQFVRFLGYREEITSLSTLKRKDMPPIWNTMVIILNGTLTAKAGSIDQVSHNILTYSKKWPST